MSRRVVLSRESTGCAGYGLLEPYICRAFAFGVVQKKAVECTTPPLGGLVLRLGYRYRMRQVGGRLRKFGRPETIFVSRRLPRCDIDDAGLKQIGG